ncbi:MAG: hypothetical protein ACRYG7_07870 [Janthinobacterium lividum]
MNRIPEGPIRYQQQGYGFFDGFLLEGNEQVWDAPNGVESLNMDRIGGASTGLLEQVRNSFKTDTAAFHRLVIRQDLHYGNLAGHMESNRVQAGETMRGAGLVNVNINEETYQFFDFYTTGAEDNKRKGYFYIDSSNPVLYADFEKAIGAILYSSAFITGELPRNEMYIVQATDASFSSITGAQFRRIEKSIDRGPSIVDPKTMRELSIGETGTGYVSQEVFSTLVAYAYNDARMLRALKIVIESSDYPLEIKGATYSVALETIKNIVLEANAEKVKPFKSKADAKRIIAQLRVIIDASADEIYNDKKAITARVDNINQATNSAGFASCFTQVGINLSVDDIKVLNNRNDFLHGRLPFEHEVKPEQNNELQFVVHKYHFLLSSLVLKFCGYSGYVKDNSKVYDVLVRGILNPKEPLFRII